MTGPERRAPQLGGRCLLGALLFLATGCAHSTVHRCDTTVGVLAHAPDVTAPLWATDSTCDVSVGALPFLGQDAIPTRIVSSSEGLLDGQHDRSRTILSVAVQRNCGDRSSRADAGLGEPLALGAAGLAVCAESVGSDRVVNETLDLGAGAILRRVRTYREGYLTVHEGDGLQTPVIFARASSAGFCVGGPGGLECGNATDAAATCSVTRERHRAEFRCTSSTDMLVRFETSRRRGVIDRYEDGKLVLRGTFSRRRGLVRRYQVTHADGTVQRWQFEEYVRR